MRLFAAFLSAALTASQGWAASAGRPRGLTFTPWVGAIPLAPAAEKVPSIDVAATAYDTLRTLQKKHPEAFADRQIAAAFEGPRAGLAVDNPAAIALEGQIRLRYVIQELLINALKFSSAGGVMEVRVAREGEHVVLRVRDEGIGIPAAELPRIAKGDYRASNARGLPGDGMGVAESSAYVRSVFAGTLALESAGEGRGTTAIVRLPIRRLVP